MGKSPQPLRILIARSLASDPSWAKFIEQGHTVHFDDPLPLDEYDIVLGPTCWRLLPHLLKYLPLALKEARAAKAKRPKRAATD